MNARAVPVDVAVSGIRAVLPIARTWRYRHPEAPGRRYRPALPPAVYACWHEHLLPLALWLSGRGFATLASEDRDGEIITRVLYGLGYVVARGSSTRGGAGGYRDLVRAARAGRPIVITADGPRGPRRVAKPGAARLAERTGLPLVPIGLGATRGARLSSWDRFLIPAPGTAVYVSTGPAVEPGERLGTALDGVTAVCERVARETRLGRPPDVARVAKAFSGPGRPARDLERRVRAAWTAPTPPIWLRSLSAGFVALRSAREALYDAGVLRAHRAALPVVSIGGATVGGSGKTPLAADVARRLIERGERVAILTRGYEDELRLHASWNPEAGVWGHPDRVRIAGRAVAEGATCAILDDGFEHRRLARDLEILALDLDALARTNRRSLPAGPFRGRWAKMLSRIDLLVITSRSFDMDVGLDAEGHEEVEREAAVVDEVRRAAARAAPGLPIARLVIGPGSPAAANEAASRGGAAPVVALTGVMKPNLFFAAARRACPSIREEVSLPDHGRPDEDTLDRLGRLPPDGGVLLTAKDFARFGDLLGRVPTWTLPDRLTWVEGDSALDAALATVLGTEAIRSGNAT